MCIALWMLLQRSTEPQLLYPPDCLCLSRVDILATGYTRNRVQLGSLGNTGHPANLGILGAFTWNRSIPMLSIQVVAPYDITFQQEGIFTSAFGYLGSAGPRPLTGAWPVVRGSTNSLTILPSATGSAKRSGRSKGRPIRSIRKVVVLQATRLET